VLTTLASPALFPRFVAQHTIGFDEADAADRDALLASVPLPAELAGAVAKRQLEFVAGRYCARLALARCSSADAGALIGSGPNREPRWPVGIVGAITHTQGYASVAVARSSQASGIGLDAEVWIDADTAARIGSLVAHRAELDAAVAALGWSPARALALLFSAKESVFKCLFPRVGHYFDFLDATVTVADPARGELSAELQVTLTPALRAGHVVAGRFDHDDRRVYTAAVAAPV
jgi:enterobactin synthetase component D